jgi:hypothetical protein
LAEAFGRGPPVNYGLRPSETQTHPPVDDAERAVVDDLRDVSGVEEAVLV